MGCATGMVKYLVFIFNLVFFLAGLGLLILGILFTVNFSEAVDLPDEAGHFKIAPVAVMIIGAVILVISFFGCCGAIKESSCMLTTYACILLAILLLQVAFGIFALLEVKDEDDLRKTVREQVKKLFDKYGTDVLARDSVNAMQQALKCCGKNSHADWPSTEIPASCCSSNTDPCRSSSGDIFRVGCTNELFDFLKDSIKIIGIVLLSLGVTEVIAAVFALCLSSSIKNEGRRSHY